MSDGELTTCENCGAPLLDNGGQAVLEDLKGLNLIEAWWDFTVFINAKG